MKKFVKDDFEFGEKLGQGKFGNVYMAREKKSNFIVAIKVMNKESVKNLKAQKQVVREIKIHSYLNHENIIKLLGFFMMRKIFISFWNMLVKGRFIKSLRNR